MVAPLPDSDFVLSDDMTSDRVNGYPTELDPPLADILIVDDMPDNLRLLSAMLSDHGYKVRKAINGDRALRAIQAVRPDLVLLDINMPEMNGYDVCRILKQGDRTADIPVIFISALDDVFDKVTAFEVGGIDYITKPFQVQEVLVRISTHLNIRQLQQKLGAQNIQLQQEVRDRMAAQQALEDLNRQLEHRVAERTAELQQANEELRTLEARLRKRLNVFLHAVSHDLRNPVLGTSMVLTNVLQQSDASVELPRSIVERMAESNTRQLSLINSLIDTHAAEIWGIVLHSEAIALAPLIHSAMTDLIPLLEQSKVSYTVQVSPDLPLVMADPMQLARVFQNLVANAVKHNPPGLTLSLTAEIDASKICCAVQDNGVGIHPDHQQRLFDLYFRGDPQRRDVGLGLGLYLCQQIIEAHGGEIGVNSSVGQGTTFWFTLPLSESV
jgi:two-component system sensor histidine kinase/response regulator